MVAITTITTTVSPAAPFDFELTAGYLTYFQGRYGTDSLSDGVYRRLLDLDGTLVLASVRPVGTIESPELAVELRGEGLTSDQASQASAQVAWLLGAQQDLAPFYSMAEKDSTMLAIAQRFHGLHLPHTASVFEALVLAILGQQIATNVARIIRTLLIETYGPSQTFEGDVYYSFPRPQDLGVVSVDELRGKKLSQRKAEYVRGIAQAALEDPTGFEGLHQLTDQEVVQSMTALQGVGNWTAQWLLIRALGREDALPLGDLALRRSVSRFYFQDVQLDDQQVEQFSRRWSPFRTYATVYMFAAMRTGMG